MIKDAEGEVTKERAQAPARNFLEYQMIALWIVVLVEGRDEILEDGIRPLLRRARGSKTDDGGNDAALDLALYLLGGDLVGLPAERAVFLFLELLFVLQDHV